MKIDMQYMDETNEQLKNSLLNSINKSKEILILVTYYVLSIGDKVSPTKQAERDNLFRKAQRKVEEIKWQVGTNYIGGWVLEHDLKIKSCQLLSAKIQKSLLLTPNPFVNVILVNKKFDEKP